MFWGLGKLRNCSNQWAKKLKTTFEMRFGELRRLQTRQKGGSGRLNELPSLLHKATVDIVGAAFGRLGGGNYPNLDAAWFPNRPKLQIVC